MSKTDETDCPALVRGQVIPAFSLPGADGIPHSPWDYKQRDHIALLFLQSAKTSEGQSILRTFARQYPTFREERCAILAITADPVIVNLQVQETLHLPFPLLSDVQGKTISRYTRWQHATLTPSIVLTDRYNALYEQWSAESEATLPPISDLLESLQYLNSICTP